MKKTIGYYLTVFISIYFFSTSCQHKNSESDNKYKTGDLIFVSADTSSFDNAVAKVTKGEQINNFSHIGIVNCTDTGTFILEAIFAGVVSTSIDDFFAKNKPSKTQSARLKLEYQKYIPQAIKHIYENIGKKYDFAFDFENDSYYCSELIYVGFVKSSGDSIFFETHNMTFKNAKTGDYLPYWTSYFNELHIDIPEGKQGTNPNIISRSDKLEWLNNN